jgi:hypothetical protein
MDKKGRWFKPAPLFVAHYSRRLYKERSHVLLLYDSFHRFVGWAALEAAGGVEHFRQQVDVAHRVEEDARASDDPMYGHVDIVLIF